MSVGTDNLHHKSKELRKRKEGTRAEIPYILIICEGEKTEPLYFEKFKVKTKTVLDLKIEGLGQNTDSLVLSAVKIKYESEKKRGIKYDQVWCVFDRDSFPADNFNQALALAQKYKFKVAYSNEAIELWFLLHFEYLEAALSRDILSDKLSDCLQDKFGCRYRKNMQNIYDLILPGQNDAIRNAEKLLNNYPDPNPEKDSPATTVHELVKELNKYMK